IGHAAGQIGAALGFAATDVVADDIPARIAWIARKKLLRGTKIERPAPLYLRPADAAPPADPAPMILPR
ncbi:MAG: hypothetical protein ACK5IR_07960, partial [Tropicimonas sp.]